MGWLVKILNYFAEIRIHKKAEKNKWRRWMLRLLQKFTDLAFDEAAGMRWILPRGWRQTQYGLHSAGTGRSQIAAVRLAGFACFIMYDLGESRAVHFPMYNGQSALCSSVVHSSFLLCDQIAQSDNSRRLCKSQGQFL